MLESNLDCFLIDILQIYNIINLHLLVQLFMNDKPSETPKGTHLPYREKIKRILYLSEKIIKRGHPLEIMKRIARIIHNPSIKMNEVARVLSSLMAERAPQILSDNRKLIEGQPWAKKVLDVAELNLLYKSD